MNNFTSSQTSASTENPIPKHLESLTTTMFQSLFPPISPQATPLTSIRRVLLLNREPSPDDSNSYIINLRHYAITTKTVTKDMPKSLRRLNSAVKDKKKRGLPNLGKLEDAADYLLDPDAGGGYTSASDSEVETDAEVEVLETTRKVLNRKEKQRTAAERQAAANGGSAGARSNVERKAVKLVELGPRMKLRLQKVEEGLCSGKVMWHEHITKTAEEVRAMDKMWDQRRKEKEERKRVQKENVERKKKEKAEKKSRGEEVDEEEEDYDEDMSDAWDSEGLDDEGAGDVEDEDEDMEDDE